MGTSLHVSCAGISRDLRKSSTPSLPGNRSLNTSLSANLTVLEVQMSCQMQYQNHVQSLNVMKILEFFNIVLVTVQFAKVNLPKYRTLRVGHCANQMTVILSINNNV